MPASDRSDVGLAQPAERRAVIAFSSAIAAMVVTVLASDAAMRFALTHAGSSPPDTRFPFRIYAAGLTMPFPVVMDHEHGWTFLGIFFAFVAVMAALSLIAAGAVRGCAERAPTLLLIGLAIVAAAMTSFPIAFSLDSYAYVAFGRLLGVYGVNPYVQHTVAASQMDDVFRPLTTFLGSRLPDENYGPLWTLMAGGLARLAPVASLGFDVWMQRAIAALSLFGAAAGLLYILRRDDPAVRASSAARFALHPLALYESAAAGHNDMLMIAPAIWSFALIVRAPLLAGVLLGAAVSIKYVALVAYPFFAFYAWRSGGLRAAAAFKLAAIATIVVCFLPLWPGWANLVSGMMDLNGTFIVSPTWLALMWLPVGAQAITLAFGAAFVVVFLFSLWRYARDCNLIHIFRSIAALLWASPLLNPWYVQWLLPAAATTGRWARYAWWFGALVLLRYIEDALRFPSSQAELSARVLLLQALTVVILVVPILLTADNVQRWFHRRGPAENA